MSSNIVGKIILTDRFSLETVLRKEGKIYTFLNPVSYLAALKNKELFSQFDGIFADGSILVSAIRILYGKKIIRTSFDMTSLAPELFSFAEKNRKKIYVVASKQEQVEKAMKILRFRYPNILIAGYRNGYFHSEDDIDIEITKICFLNPDFLIVGMGALKQEEFLMKIGKAGYKGIGFTCGGFIHQISKDEIDYYPEWIDKLNLRFVYRMYKEKHTRKRYLLAAFIFPILFFVEHLKKDEKNLIK